MSAQRLIPIGHTELVDIRDVEPLNDEDRECLAELRDVLLRYKKLDRFGVRLLHGHFAIEEDEILVESTDINRRIAISKVYSKDDPVAQTAIETEWQLSTGQVTAACRAKCTFDPYKEEHNQDHWLP